MTDQTAAELITRRLTEPLSDAEEIALNEHLKHSAQSRKFSEQLARIQESVQHHRKIDNSDLAGPGLDAVTKERLQRRLLAELNTNSNLRQVAEDEAGYRGTTGQDDET